MVTCQQLGHTPSQTQPFDISKTRGSLAVSRGDLNPSIVCRAGRNKAIRLESRRDSCEGGQNKRVKISFCRIGETNGFPKRTTAQGGSETKTRKTEGEYLGGWFGGEVIDKTRCWRLKGGRGVRSSVGVGGEIRLGVLRLEFLFGSRCFYFPVRGAFQAVSFFACIYSIQEALSERGGSI